MGHHNRNRQEEGAINLQVKLLVLAHPSVNGAAKMGIISRKIAQLKTLNVTSVQR